MPIVYFDSSAFVKLLVEEEGSDEAAILWDGCDAAVSSRLAYPEVCAALAAATRAHRLEPADHDRVARVWDDFWAAVRPVELSAAISQHAGDLARRHALRGADAVHLASARAIGEDVIFAAWDRRLRSGAISVGISAVPATLAGG